MQIFRMSRTRILFALAFAATLIGQSLYREVQASSTASATATANSNIIASITTHDATDLQLRRCRAERWRQDDERQRRSFRSGLGGKPHARVSFNVVGRPAMLTRSPSLRHRSR